jgi:hypothetical protein
MQELCIANHKILLKEIKEQPDKQKDIHGWRRGSRVRVPAW